MAAYVMIKGVKYARNAVVWIRRKGTLKSFPVPKEKAFKKVTAWHGTNKRFTKFSTSSKVKSLHAGSKQAAKERVSGLNAFSQKRNVHKITFTPKKPFLKKNKQGNYRLYNEFVHEDRRFLFRLQDRRGREYKDLVKRGYDVIPYVNHFESPSSISYLILNPKIVRRRGALKFKTTGTRKHKITPTQLVRGGGSEQKVKWGREVIKPVKKFSVDTLFTEPLPPNFNNFLQFMKHVGKKS